MISEYLNAGTCIKGSCQFPILVDSSDKRLIME